MLAREAIEALFAGGQRVSFHDAYRAANKSLGYPEYDQRAPGYRLADQHIQRLRKRGLIEKQRYGGVWHWIATPAWEAR